MNRAVPKNPLRDFNLNSILVLVAGALVTWLVTNGLSTAKDTRAATVETKQSVAEIKTALPFMVKAQDRLEADVKEVKNDVKDAKEKMVTRAELDNKHTRLLNEITDVKNEQKQVRDELQKKRP